MKSYLYRTLLNALLDSSKAARNRSLPLDEYVDIPIDDTGLMQIFEANDSDLKKVQLLKKGFQQLSSKQRNAIYFRFVQEFSWDELADMFEMSSHSCMNLVGRSVAKLRQIVLSGGNFTKKIFCTFFPDKLRSNKELVRLINRMNEKNN